MCWLSNATVNIVVATEVLSANVAVFPESIANVPNCICFPYLALLQKESLVVYGIVLLNEKSIKRFIGKKYV